MASDFELFMGLHLNETRGDEATKAVLELWDLHGDGRTLEDAVLDVIESLPTRKTEKLRGFVQQFHAYLEWLDYERVNGWRILPRSRGIHPFYEKPGTLILVRMTEEEQQRVDRLGIADDASDAVAAAVGARSVHFIGDATHMPGLSYEVEKAW